MRERILTIEVTDLSGNIVNEPQLEYADGVTYRTQYPGGIYASASFILPYRTIDRTTELSGGQLIKILDGPRIVWEGVIDSIDTEQESGARVDCVGPWAAYFERRGIDRRWADNRISPDIWQWSSTASAASNASRRVVDTTLRVNANLSDEWKINTFYSLDYTSPTSETVGYITFDFDFFEPPGQSWRQRIYDGTNSTTLWSASTTSTGSTTITLSPTASSISLQLVSLSTQTPSDTCQAEWSNLMLYASRDHASATLGNVSAYEVTLDIVDRLAVDETLISANLTDVSTAASLAVKPFYTRGRESFAAIIDRIAGYGDSAQNSIGYGLRRSQLASDSKPLMFLEAYPALTDYDYEISIEDGDVRVRENADDVQNWISVSYTDGEGARRVVTPDDDSSLKDTTSIAAYGQREKTISAGSATSTTATNYGKRYLARHKDPTWAVSAPVRVTEILSKAGGIIPGSQIEAGKRLRIVDLPDRPNSGILGVNFIIVSTDYDNESGICSLSLGGTPDDLGIFLAQQRLGE